MYIVTVISCRYCFQRQVYALLALHYFFIIDFGLGQISPVEKPRLWSCTKQTYIYASGGEGFIVLNIYISLFSTFIHFNKIISGNFFLTEGWQRIRFSSKNRRLRGICLFCLVWWVLRYTNTAQDI